MILNSHFTRTVKNEMEEKTDFESDARDDPLESLRRIRQNVCMPNALKCKCEGSMETVKHLIVDAKQMDSGVNGTHEEVQTGKGCCQPNLGSGGIECSWCTQDWCCPCETCGQNP